MQHEQPDNISDAGLDTEEFLALHIDESATTKTISDDRIRTKNSQVWFFQVASVAELTQAPVLPRGTDGTETGPISANSGIDYQFLHDANGDDLLRNDDSPWRVYHFSIGVRQDQIRIYPRIPDNQNGGAWDYLSGSEPDPTNGDDFGYTPGSETDYDDPSTKLETLAWELGDFSVHQWGFFNEDSQIQINPTLSIRGFGYELRPVEQQSEMFRLLADLERPVDKRKRAVKLVDFSRAALRSFSFDVPGAWSDAENALDIAQVNLPEVLEQPTPTRTVQESASEAEEAASEAGGQ